MSDDPFLTSELGRAMLRAGAAEEPDRAAVDRVLAAVGDVGHVAPVTTAPVAPRPTVPPLVKWGAAAALCALAVLAGVLVVGRSNPPPLAPEAPAPPVVNAPVPTAPEPASAGASVVPAAPAPSELPVPPPRSTSRAAPPAKPADSSLAEELAAVAAARAALAGGDTQGCLARLAAYAKRFPRGVLAQEALVIRIDALVRSGDRAGARVLADRALAGHASSPYATRIRSLLGDPATP